MDEKDIKRLRALGFELKEEINEYEWKIPDIIPPKGWKEDRKPGLFRDKTGNPRIQLVFPIFVTSPSRLWNIDVIFLTQFELCVGNCGEYTVALVVDHLKGKDNICFSVIKKENAAKEARAWLRKNFPKWKNPNAYWD